MSNTNTNTTEQQQTSSNIEEQFATLTTNVSEMAKQCKVLQEDLRCLQKLYKLADKKSRVRPKKEQPKNTPSNELRKFLSIGTDPVTKAEVMKLVSAYIKTTNLQLEDNKRKFLPNKALLKLFGQSSAKEMTFVEINKSISHHLTKLE